MRTAAPGAASSTERPSRQGKALHIPVSGGEGDVMGGAPVPDEPLVPVRRRTPELVVEVGGRDVRPPLPAPLVQQVQKAHGVQPPGHAHSAVSPRPGSTHRGQRESSSSMSAPHFSKSDLSPRRTVCPASRTWCTPAVPHGAGRRGGPFLSQSSGEVNSPSGRFRQNGETLGRPCRAAPLCGADKPQSSSYLVSNVENVVYSGSSPRRGAPRGPLSISILGRSEFALRQGFAKMANAWTRCRAAPLCGADKPQSSSYLVSNVENVVYSGSSPRRGAPRGPLSISILGRSEFALRQGFAKMAKRLDALPRGPALRGR